MSRRVVVTGIGVISSLGIGKEALWQALMTGRTAIGPITQFDASGFGSTLAGEVTEFSVKDHVPKSYRKSIKVMCRDTELAVAAAKLAVEDAGLVTRGTLEEDLAGALAAGSKGSDLKTTYPSERVGCHIGAGLIAAESQEMAMAMSTSRLTAASESPGANGFSLRAWGGEGGAGMEALTPLWLLKYLPNMLACHVTIIHGCEGPSNTITCAEASGLLSIGESTRVILRGAADACFSGGAESRVNVMGLLRLDLSGWLQQTQGQPELDGAKWIKPFEQTPGLGAGTLLGEGGGILILEERGGALGRGATPLAEVVGFGGGHSAPWYPDGEADEGYRNAILNALDDARVTPEQVSAIVPLACGVPRVDRAELGALKAVFGNRLGQIPMITLIPNLGSTQAGVGGLQVAIGAMCLAKQQLPARVHFGNPVAGVQVGPASARAAKLDYVLVCSGSVGAQNAAVVLGASR